MLTEIRLRFLMSNNIPLVVPTVSGHFRRDPLGQAPIMLETTDVMTRQRNLSINAADIKLEANIEYRFDITKMFKGAVFLDGGNIWLLKQGPGQTDNGKAEVSTQRHFLTS